MDRIRSCHEVELFIDILQLEQTEADLLLCIPETAKLALEAYTLISDEEIKRRTQLVCLGQNQHDIVDLLPLVLKKSSKDGSSVLPYIADDPKNELCSITWSSGTTGKPLRFFVLIILVVEHWNVRYTQGNLPLSLFNPKLHVFLPVTFC